MSIWKVTTLLLYACYVVTYHCCNFVAARMCRQGGFPKFITRSCGIRNVHWFPTRDPRIIGGEIPPRGAVPWQVDVRIKRKHRCGGVILSEQLIITAAHCVREDDDVFVVLGSYDEKPNQHEQVIRVQTVTRHPEFRINGPYSNDIALLLLESQINMGNYVQKACLPHAQISDGSWCEVSGWGIRDTKSLEKSTMLRSAAVPIISLETCRKDDIYGGRVQAILDTMLCAGHLRGGIDACGGDSGGPLMCDRDGRLELAGIVSWGDGCAKSNRPGVYTRIASYLTWIQETAQQLGVDYN